jgi:hypothetical protein
LCHADFNRGGDGALVLGIVEGLPITASRSTTAELAIATGEHRDDCRDFASSRGGVIRRQGIRSTGVMNVTRK